MQSTRGSTVSNTIQPIVPCQGTMRSRMGLFNLGTTTNSQRHMSPIVEGPASGTPIRVTAGTECGFQKVAHKKYQPPMQAVPERRAASAMLIPSAQVAPYQSNGRTRIRTSPPSAAAASRASNYSRQFGTQPRERSQSHATAQHSGLLTMPK